MHEHDRSHHGHYDITCGSRTRLTPKLLLLRQKQNLARYVCRGTVVPNPLTPALLMCFSFLRLKPRSQHVSPKKPARTWSNKLKPKQMKLLQLQRAIRQDKTKIHCSFKRCVSDCESTILLDCSGCPRRAQARSRSCSGGLSTPNVRGVVVIALCSKLVVLTVPWQTNAALKLSKTLQL